MLYRRVVVERLPPFGVSKMVDQEEYQQGNSIGEIQLAELKQKQSA